MKIKKNGMDDVIYIFACILSCGAVWLARVIISMGIRKALDE